MESRIVPSTTPVYSNDFESQIGPEWTTNRLSTTPVGNRHFHGEFGNQTESLSLANLGKHDQVTVSFALYVIRSWDGSDNLRWGPDHWKLAVAGGSTLIDTTFSNQPIASPGAYNKIQDFGEHTNSAQLNYAFSGAAESNTLGYTFWSGNDGS